MSPLHRGWLYREITVKTPTPPTGGLNRRSEASG